MFGNLSHIRELISDNDTQKHKHLCYELDI